VRKEVFSISYSIALCGSVWLVIFCFLVWWSEDYRRGETGIFLFYEWLGWEWIGGMRPGTVRKRNRILLSDICGIGP
jgi:hypothetical protein